ncbi:MAG: ATP-binding protein [Desulfobacteraceae bacterium]
MDQKPSYEELEQRVKDFENTEAHLRQVQESLRKNQERYRKAQKIGKVGNWEYYIQSGEFRASEQARIIFGFDLDRDTFTPEEIESRIPERERVHQALVDLMEKGGEYNIEFEILTEDTCELKTIISIAELEKDESGNPVKISGVIQDITDRKHALEETKQQKKLFKTMFNTIPDGVVITNTNREILLANKGMQTTFGYDPKDLQGKSTELLYADHSDFRETGEAVFDRHARKPGDLFVTRYLHKTGRIFPGETFGAKLFDEDGNWVGNLGIMRDITERVEHEKSLLMLKDRLESLWNISRITDSDIKTICDKVLSELQKITRSSYAFYGFLSEDEALMTIYSWSEQANSECLISDKPVDFPIDKAGIWAEAVRYKKAVMINDYQQDLTAKKGMPQGHVPLTRVMVVPVLAKGKVVSIAAVANKADRYTLDDENQVKAFLASVQTIIDKKNSERENMELMTRLQQAQKMEAIGNLAGGIAHDFNNILFPITGLSELLLEEFSPDSSEYDNIKEIFHAGRRGRDLVQQILSVARQSEQNYMPVKIQMILKEVLKLIRSTTPSNIEIIRDIDKGCGSVMADPTRLHQVAMNLLTNANHALGTANGEICVSLKEVEYKQEDINHPELEPGRYAELSVSDTGCGISPAVIDKIFDPYFTTKDKERGTGLGLSLVYGIVREYGGDVRVRSEIGKGTRFEVLLPILLKPEPDSMEDKTEDLPSGTERILLVDDEASIVRLEKMMHVNTYFSITCPCINVTCRYIC